jgi:glycerol-3-phosphate dehydrogenase
MECWLSAPNIQTSGLKAAFSYFDGIVDDARLVYRVLSEAENLGASIMNYAKVEGLLKNASGDVVGLGLRDLRSDLTHEVRAKVVVNASGAWADGLRAHLGKPAILRPLRGSHLIFPRSKLPVALSVTFSHQKDHRPIYAFPWEGVTLVGTTDTDHEAPLDNDPLASEEEITYLFEGLERRFREFDLSPWDMMGTYAGVRPVIGTKGRPPSEESREEALFDEQGLITITGGKLTTFRVMAEKALACILKRVGRGGLKARKLTVGLDSIPQEALLSAMEAHPELGLPRVLRLAGRYGEGFMDFLSVADPKDLATIPGTPYGFAELVYGAKHERVEHLDDLLLRRTRIGHLLPKGGSELESELKKRLLGPLGWEEARWEAEWKAYLELIERVYSPKKG